MPVHLGRHLAAHQSGPLTQELAENSFLEMAPPDSKFPYILQRTSGLTAFVKPGATAPVRGITHVDNYVYTVIGDTLYRVSQSGAFDNLGHIADVGQVRMSMRGANSDYIWIGTASTAYAANASNLLALSNAQRLVGIDQQDGYMLGVERSSNKLWRSTLDDPTTVSALGFTTVDTYGDDVVGMVSQGRQPLVFKQLSIEAFYNDGSAKVFSRTEVVARGCAAGDSIVKDTTGVYFLGEDLLVYRLVGYQAQAISTETVARLIQAQVSPQTAVGWMYQEAGHTFYILSFSGLTLSYDLNTSLWSKRVSHGRDNWRVSCHVWVPGWRKHVVGDVASGDLMFLDPEAYNEMDDPLRWRVTAPPMWNNTHRTSVAEFIADIETGVSTTAGVEPEVVLDWSNNGGKTYQGGIARGFGAPGEYNKRVRWGSLGAHESWTPRLTVVDDVPVRCAGAYVRATRLAA